MRSPRAYLSAIVTRLCIDRRQSIEERKKTYIGPWLPDPIVEAGATIRRTARDRRVGVDGAAPGPREPLARRARGLSPPSHLRLRLRRDRRDPRQVRGELPAARQPGRGAHPPATAAIRGPARGGGAADRRRSSPACSSGDMQGLLDVLAPDAVLYSDGGGKAAAALAPIRRRGPDRAPVPRHPEEGPGGAGGPRGARQRTAGTAGHWSMGRSSRC